MVGHIGTESNFIEENWKTERNFICKKINMKTTFGVHNQPTSFQVNSSTVNFTYYGHGYCGQMLIMDKLAGKTF